LSCANSSHARGHWLDCEGHWCHGCYQLKEEGIFPIRRPTDEAGYVLTLEKDATRFMFGREGDNLMTIFQCDTCHFRNIKKRSPNEDGSDDMVLTFIRRANLDALWSRETSTVRNNAREINKLRVKASIFDFPVDDMLPALGPFPVSDIQGMRIAVCVLLRTLDAGKTEPTIQYSTSQRLKTAFANMWKVSPQGLPGAVIARDTVKLFHTSCPTHGDWFEKFTKGLHERMGDKVRQDLAISIDQMHELMDNYNVRWMNAGNDRAVQRSVLFPALFCIVAFCCGLRGEEVPLMSLTGSIRHWEEAANHHTPHTVVALLGKFKTLNSVKYHIMPLVQVTATGLQPGLWMQRMITWYREGGVVDGWVFRDVKNGAAKASEYEWDILCELERIQRDKPEVISKNVNVMEEFGVSRSFRRGSDTHAINQGLSTLVIECNNRWRSLEMAHGKAPSLRMIHHYSDIQQLLPTLLEYSKAL
jgi:hypothetical protein